MIVHDKIQELRNKTGAGSITKDFHADILAKVVETMYSPTPYVGSVFPSTLSRNVTTKVLVEGLNLDYYETFEIIATDMTGLSVTLVAETPTTVSFNVTTGSVIQDMIVRMTTKLGRVTDISLETFSAVVYTPDVSGSALTQWTISNQTPTIGAGTFAGTTVGSAWSSAWWGGFSGADRVEFEWTCVSSTGTMLIALLDTVYRKDYNHHSVRIGYGSIDF